METVGSRIKQARKAKGWSQPQLAAAVRAINHKLTTSHTTIASIEQNKSKTTTILNEIAIALGVTETWLRTGKGQKQPETATLTEVRIVLDHVAECVFASYEALGLPVDYARELTELVLECAQEPSVSGESPRPQDRRFLASSLTRRFLNSKHIQRFGA